MVGADHSPPARAEYTYLAPLLLLFTRACKIFRVSNLVLRGIFRAPFTFTLCETLHNSRSASHDMHECRIRQSRVLHVHHEKHGDNTGTHVWTGIIYMCLLQYMHGIHVWLHAGTCTCTKTLS